MTGVTPHGIRYPDGASRAKNLGPELQQMAEDIDRYLDEQIDGANPAFQQIIRDLASILVANAIAAADLVQLVKCVHLEAGKWVWDGPDAPAATHYVLPDDTGALVVRATPFPTPLAAPALNW